MPTSSRTPGTPGRPGCSPADLENGFGVAEAARLVGDFVRCLSASATPDQQQAAPTAADQRTALLGPQLTADDTGLPSSLVRAANGAAWPQAAPLPAIAIGFLSQQTYDATAGLIGDTVVALAGAWRPRARNWNRARES